MISKNTMIVPQESKPLCGIIPSTGHRDSPCPRILSESLGVHVSTKQS